MAERTIGFDLDGVLARPATYFVNVAAFSASRPDNRAWEPPSPSLGTALRAIFAKGPVKDEGEVRPESSAERSASGLRRAAEATRYALRFPMPDARQILEGLKPYARLVLLTNRNAVNRPRLEGWLKDKGLAPYLDAIHLNDSGEAGTHFKLRKLKELEIGEYVEDNPEICEHLSVSGIRVYFREWAGVRRPSGDSIIPFRTAEQLISAVRERRPV